MTQIPARPGARGAPMIAARAPVELTDLESDGFDGRAGRLLGIASGEARMLRVLILADGRSVRTAALDALIRPNAARVDVDGRRRVHVHIYHLRRALADLGVAAGIDIVVDAEGRAYGYRLCGAATVQDFVLGGGERR